jgi:hypothetical protein
VTCDNASSNAVQASALHGLENCFDETNRVRCFNHSIQLSGKALIKPFNVGMGKADIGTENSVTDAPSLEEFDYDDDGNGNGDDEPGLLEDSGEDGTDGEEETLSQEELSALLANTSAVRETVSEVCQISVLFDIADLYLIALPTFLRHHSFDNHCPPCMATILRCPWPEGEVDASGRRHALELNIRYDGICSSVSGAN